MTWISLKTEFTFKGVFGHIDDVAKKCASLGGKSAGIADTNNTFGHLPWRKACKAAGIKPIYGVKLPVYEDALLKERRIAFNQMTFIAKTSKGLQEIYYLIDVAHKQFYYTPRISYHQINELSSDVAILSGVAPRWDLIKRFVFKELGPNIPFSQWDNNPNKMPEIACIDNYYPEVDDKKIYEPFADNRLWESKSYPLHIWSKEDWESHFPNRKKALSNLEKLSKHCNVELPNAPMVQYIGSDDMAHWCEQGAKKHGIDIWNDGKYKERYEREIKLINSKDYVDYFLVVADLIRYAKTKMAVGPSRGSSAGSLVCYLMGITEIDPLEYDLYFERFIDVNRFDLPDIDIDFQDDKRHMCLKYLSKKYGPECVAQIGNINRMKAKSAITRFAKSLNIPIGEVEELKDAIMDRSGGDARSKFCIEDTIKDTDIGKRFIEKYPQMGVVSKIESHALHTGIHAAGILVCNRPITDYAGVNCRDNKRIAMLDKKDAESINLLKIDALGLRTLSILATVCDQIGKPYDWLYEIPLDDQKAYDVFNDHRYNGIFQFEGPAIKGLAKNMPVEHIDDITALTALGRPGPLNSGGANRFIKFRTGKEKPKYLADHPAIIKATKKTYGTIIYQEQIMTIGREYGRLSWKDLDTLRRAMSKSYGEEFFGQYREKFLAGAIKNGSSEDEAKVVWGGILTFGSYGFNQSHAVAYALISYLCAYMKGNYPMEFVVACLNHARSDQSAVKILRDAIENDGVVYKHFDKFKSEANWGVKDGILYGGIKTLHGMAVKKANQFIKLRRDREPLPAGMKAIIKKAKSPFKYLYPGREIYGDYYTDPASNNLNNPATHIKDADHDGYHTVIGCMIKKNLRDANEACFVTERGGKYETGQTAWLNITLEDDTDSMMVKIKKEDYNRIGKDIAETGKENRDWYMAYGKKINGWNIMFVQNIMKITREE